MISRKKIWIDIEEPKTGIMFKSLIERLNQHNYESAIRFLKIYISETSDLYTKNYARYLIGYAYLKSVKISNNNKEKINKDSNVRNGLQYLNLVLEHTNNEGLKEDALWYLGKAYLLLDEVTQAKIYFNKVSLMRGPRADDSQVILYNLSNKIK